MAPHIARTSYLLRIVCPQHVSLWPLSFPRNAIVFLPPMSRGYTTCHEYELAPLYSLYFLPHRVSLQRVLIVVCCNKRSMGIVATGVRGSSTIDDEHGDRGATLLRATTEVAFFCCMLQRATHSATTDFAFCYISQTSIVIFATICVTPSNCYNRQNNKLRWLSDKTIFAGTGSRFCWNRRAKMLQW